MGWGRGGGTRTWAGVVLRGWPGRAPELRSPQAPESLSRSPVPPMAWERSFEELPALASTEPPVRVQAASSHRHCGDSAHAPVTPRSVPSLPAPSCASSSTSARKPSVFKLQRIPMPALSVGSKRWGHSEVLAPLSTPPYPHTKLRWRERASERASQQARGCLNIKRESLGV